MSVSDVPFNTEYTL